MQQRRCAPPDCRQYPHDLHVVVVLLQLDADALELEAIWVLNWSYSTGGKYSVWGSRARAYAFMKLVKTSSLWNLSMLSCSVV